MDQLIKDNMGLVITIVDSFNPQNITERKDLIDAGRIGLWKALQKYDVAKGAVSTYVWRPIQWAVIKEIRSRRSNVSINRIPEPGIEEKAPFWEILSSDLSEEDHQILTLRTQGYKFKEICLIVSKSSSAVKNRYYKIIKNIKKANVE